MVTTASTLSFHAAKRLMYLLHTLFLFTKSDVKTVIIPVTVFSVAAAPLYSLSRLPHVIFWTWLHVLQCCTSNQTMDTAEDAMNKPDRPLPAKRITREAAVQLRWTLVPICWAVSAAYSAEVLYSSVVLAAFIFIYNELATNSGHWFIRNVMNAAGLISFETGATLIAGLDCKTLDPVALLSICISAGVITTTIHSQDFRDTEGDRAIGRQTIPIMFPTFARWTVLIPLFAWSVGLSVVWQLDVVTGGVFTLLAAFVGFRYLVIASAHGDQISYNWYNIWLSLAHALPGYYRLYAHST